MRDSGLLHLTTDPNPPPDLAESGLEVGVGAGVGASQARARLSSDTIPRGPKKILSRWGRLSQMAHRLGVGGV